VGVISGAGGGLGASGGTATGPTGGGIATGGAAGGGGVVVQAAKDRATMAREAVTLRRVDSIRTGMWILLLEAGAALFVLLFLVWWTMFSGRD
jgi:hypothetical protein